MNYALITPARNEEAYIEKTLQSVVDQTVLPKKWVIVSDGSTDRTDEIVKRYRGDYDFIQLLPRESTSGRNFGSKVYAFRAGLKRLNDIKYDLIGNLDADVSFDASYYERILETFQDNPRLGIAGGILYEANAGKWIRQYANESWSVSGPIQMFRRQCYEEINGYMPLEKGGVDAVAEVMARMHGWEVRAFAQLKVLHLRRTGTATSNVLLARFRKGVIHHRHGNHPVFEAAKCIYRIFEMPYVLGALFMMAGYCWSWIQRNEYSIPDSIIKYMRTEQKKRLLSIPLIKTKMWGNS